MPNLKKLNFSVRFAIEKPAKSLLSPLMPSFPNLLFWHLLPYLQIIFWYCYLLKNFQGLKN